MNRIERGFGEVQRALPNSRVLKPLRDDWGIYGLNVILDGQIGVFSVKVSKKQPHNAGLEVAKRGTFLSCHAQMCDHRVPIFILHDGIVWRIQPQAITGAFAFKNWVHGALFLNFYSVDVEAESLHRIDDRGGRCITCGGVVPNKNMQCEKCQRNTGVPKHATR